MRLPDSSVGGVRRAVPDSERALPLGSSFHWPGTTTNCPSLGDFLSWCHPRIVSGLTILATSSSARFPSCFPISARVRRSPSVRPRRPCRNRYAGARSSLLTLLATGSTTCYTAHMLYNWVVPISGKAIVKRLKQEGWTIKSQSGSHVKLENEFSEIVIVPVHGNKDLGKGLVKKIEKETGVKLI